jgi:hypothetical protein
MAGGHDGRTVTAANGTLFVALAVTACSSLTADCLESAWVKSTPGMAVVGRTDCQSAELDADIRARTLEPGATGLTVGFAKETLGTVRIGG